MRPSPRAASLAVLTLATAACAIAAPGNSASAQVDAKQTTARLKPAPGLEATLWAAEPLLVNPTNIDIDSRGRVWVAEGLNYRLSRGGNRRFHRIEEADRIKILEDTDGDGKADKVTVFADRVFPVPMGIAVEEHHDASGKYTGCRVFVGNSPDLLVLEDTDGDDKADKRYPLLTGFGGVDSDHGVHGMTLGLDGKLYFSHGDGCCSVQHDHSERQQNFDVIDKGGRHVWTDQLANTLRVDRDGTNFEIICDRQRNNYETSLNSFGEIFTSDNDDDGNRGCRVIQAMDGGHFGYHTPGSPLHWGEDVPGNVPKLVGTGNGSPCGIMVYEGSLLPPEYRGAILEVDAGTRQVNFFPLSRAGGSYRTEYKVFLAGTDPWFRPVDACAAPDGSVYVADWYDAGVGGHAFSDQTTGRIYRVAPKGNKPANPRPDFGSLDGLMKALRSPNIATQDAARRGLIALAKTQPASQKAGEMALQDPDPIMRARALWVWSAIDGVAPAAIMLNITASGDEPRLRAQVVRMIARDCRQNGNVHYSQGSPQPPPIEPWVLETLKLVAKDPDAQVRREAILALRNLPTKDVGETLRELAASWDGQDRWYLEALGLALDQRDSGYLAHLMDGSLYGELALVRDGDRGDVALPPYFPVDRNEAFIPTGAPIRPATPLAKNLGLCWRLHRMEALPFLERVIPALRAPELEQAAFDTLERIAQPAAAPAVARLAGRAADPETRRGLCAILARRLRTEWKPARADAAVVGLVERLLADPDSRGDGIAMAASMGDERYFTAIEHLAADRSLPTPIRQSAIQALGAWAGRSRELLDRMIADSRGKPSATPEAEAAVQTLGRTPGGPERLRAIATSADYPLGVRRQALRGVFLERDGGRIILEMARSKTLPDDLKPEATALLQASSDRRLRADAAKLLPPPVAAGGRPLPPPAVLARRVGDAPRGQAVFFRESQLACSSCHRVQGRGQWVGPDLSTIGVKYGRQELLNSILNPSAAVGYNFRAVVAGLSDGRVVTGLPVEDTPEKLVLKTALGERVSIPTRDVDDRKTSDVSLMPEGLAQSMTETELVDLVAYLATLREPVSVVGRYQGTGPITELDAKALAVADGHAASKLVLRRLTADAEGQVDLGRFMGDASHGAVVATPLISPTDQKARLVLETTAQVVAWLDGKPRDLKTETVGKGVWRETTLDLPRGTSRLVIWLKKGSSGDDGRLVTTVISARSVGFDESSAATLGAVKP